MFYIKVLKTPSARFVDPYEGYGIYAMPPCRFEGYVTEYDPQQFGTIAEALAFETEDDANEWLEEQFDNGVYDIDEDEVIMEVVEAQWIH